MSVERSQDVIRVHWTRPARLQGIPCIGSEDTHRPVPSVDLPVVEDQQHVVRVLHRALILSRPRQALAGFRAQEFASQRPHSGRLQLLCRLPTGCHLPVCGGAVVVGGIGRLGDGAGEAGEGRRIGEASARCGAAAAAASDLVSLGAGSGRRPFATQLLPHPPLQYPVSDLRQGMGCRGEGGWVLVLVLVHGVFDESPRVWALLLEPGEQAREIASEGGTLRHRGLHICIGSSLVRGSCVCVYMHVVGRKWCGRVAMTRYQHEAGCGALARQRQWPPHVDSVVNSLANLVCSRGLEQSGFGEQRRRRPGTWCDEAGYDLENNGFRCGLWC
ncbi:unnamed protein product [Mycena citricolor]|uniref:Uncharacterized protein n=1 Tax=Mycena citricolor TaxID=2018698 RepID=A0AAD2K768_9AGAR|nr:unnamed protein product [Mycena citricolor]CAK5282743.1 unnamed protein product [Mycena citricolor]